MKKKSQKLIRNLEAMSDRGVLLYQEERPASPRDIAANMCVREKMDYIPEFIVMDEQGQLKEIWYGRNASLDQK